MLSQISIIHSAKKIVVVQIVKNPLNINMVGYPLPFIWNIILKRHPLRVNSGGSFVTLTWISTVTSVTTCDYAGLPLGLVGSAVRGQLPLSISRTVDIRKLVHRQKTLKCKEKLQKKFFNFPMKKFRLWFSSQAVLQCYLKEEEIWQWRKDRLKHEWWSYNGSIF